MNIKILEIIEELLRRFLSLLTLVLWIPIGLALWLFLGKPKAEKVESALINTKFCRWIDGGF